MELLHVPELPDAVPQVELHGHAVLPVQAGQLGRHVAIVGVKLCLLHAAVSDHKHNLANKESVM